MGITERKEREKKQRKEQILEAARRLFQERGFLNVTISDIAEAVELSIGSLYLYFKNKEDLYAGLACLGCQKFDTLLDEALYKKKKLTQKELVAFIENKIWENIIFRKDSTGSSCLPVTVSSSFKSSAPTSVIILKSISSLFLK